MNIYDIVFFNTPNNVKWTILETFKAFELCVAIL